MAYRKSASWGQQKPPTGTQIDWGNPITKGLVGRYLMAEHGGDFAFDSVARSPNSMRRYAGTSFTPGRFGGYSTLFDGAAGKLRIETWGLKTLVTALPFTFMGWGKVTDGASGVRILSASDEATLNAFFLLSVAGTTLTFNATNGDAVSNNAATSSITATVGQWYHITGVWTTTTDRKVYVNGQLAGSDTNLRATDIGLIDNLVVGALQRSSTNYSSGQVDNLSVWNRALSPQEIWTLYQEPFADFQRPQRRISNALASAQTSYMLVA